MIRDQETLNPLLDTVARFVRERLVPAEAIRIRQPKTRVGKDRWTVC